MVQTDNSALGRVVNETAVSGLPLVTRNFAQIAALSPGVVAGCSTPESSDSGERRCRTSKFLLGLNAAGNGTGTFSNVFGSIDAFGLVDREYRVWEGSAFAQDDFRVSKSLTINAGLRYERLGQFGDRLGRNASFEIGKADPNPPPGGSLAGYLVASNFSGAVPGGVQRVDNSFGNEGAGQNTIAPRLGFSWQILPGRSPLILRGGYGMYYSRPTGQASF
jgi:hypothetical protein